MLRLPQRVLDITTSIYTAVLIIGSLLPSTGLPSASGMDKVEHFFAYLILALLVSLTLRRRANGREMLFAFLFATGLGVIIEILQGMGGVRECSSWDAVADSLGAIAGCLVFYIWRDKRAGKNHEKV